MGDSAYRAVFCMECGPEVSLEDLAGKGDRRLRCPECGLEVAVPAYDLFVVTGASGAGKTSVVKPLRDRLSGLEPGYEVFEKDAILHVEALGGDRFGEAWLQIAAEVAANDRRTVLCGSFVPDAFERLPSRRLIGPIRYANLDADAVTLATRLRARPTWRGADETFVERQVRWAAELRTTVEPSIDTTRLTPAAVADELAAWIRSYA